MADGTLGERMDIKRLRAETAGCEGQVFFNNAGASLQPRPVVERVIEHLRLEEQMGGYEAADRVQPESAAVYASVARLLNAKPDEIALTESATRAWDMAFYSIPLQAGDRVLTAENEYASNYIALLQRARTTGAVIEVVPSERDGTVSLSALEAALRRDGRARVLSLTHVATNNGMVQPAAEAGRLARQHGALLLLDACQSAGQLPLDVEELGCDMLSAAGRKYLRGPRGTGFLYVRRALVREIEPVLLDMHAAEWTGRNAYEMRADAKRFEAWESSLACRLGMGRAIEYALALGIPAIAKRVGRLAAWLRAGLRATGVARVEDLGAGGQRDECGIVTFTHARLTAGQVVESLARQRMVVRVSPRNATRLDMEQRGLEAVVRASVHYYNTEEEVARFCAAVERL